MKIVKLTAVALITLCASFCAQGAQKYTLQYAPNSPIKSVPLQNATVMLELYDYEKPDGFKRVKTNANQAFFVNQGQDFEVVGIVGERKQNARCSGYATTTQQKILIRCEKF